MALTVLASTAASGAVTTNQTNVHQAIMSAVANNLIPSNVTPSLASVANPTGVYAAQGSSMGFKCSPGSFPKFITKPVPCWLGSPTGVTWVLWGDSNAGSWIPAVAKVAASKKVRLAVFVYPGCASQFVQGTEQGGLVKVADCTAFHRALPAAIKALAPKVVISATLGMGFSGNQSDIPAFATAWKNTFDAITSSKSTIRRVLLGTTPNLAGRNIAACLAAAKDKLLLPCSARYFSGAWYGTNYWSYVQRDIAAATTAKATLIMTDALFCDTTSVSPNYCPSIVANKLVYVDQDHISIAYMNYIAPALTELFGNAGF